MMKRFKLINRAVDLNDIARELIESDAWLPMDGTYLAGGKNPGSQVIRLRGGAERPGYYGDIMDVIELWPWQELPLTRTFLLNFAAEAGGHLGRARVAMMDSRASIIPHIDEGSYFRAHDRYHAVVRSPSGSLFHVGDESQVMREGELWWLDNSVLHSVENLSDAPRIHLVFDVRPFVGRRVCGPEAMPS